MSVLVVNGLTQPVPVNVVTGGSSASPSFQASSEGMSTTTLWSAQSNNSTSPSALYPGISYMAAFTGQVMLPIAFQGSSAHPSSCKIGTGGVYVSDMDNVPGIGSALSATTAKRRVDVHLCLSSGAASYPGSLAGVVPASILDLFFYEVGSTTGPYLPLFLPVEAGDSMTAGANVTGIQLPHSCSQNVPHATLRLPGGGSPPNYSPVAHLSYEIQGPTGMTSRPMVLGGVWTMPEAGPYTTPTTVNFFFDVTIVVTVLAA